MRHRADIARTLLCLGIVLTSASCEALFGGLSQANPESCVANPELCQASESVCNELTRECEPALRLESISPRAALYDKEVMVTIQGRNFVPGMTLTIGGRSATQVQVVSATQLTAMAPVFRGSKERMEVILTAPSGQKLSAGKLFHYFPFPQFAPVIQISSPTTSTMFRAADFNQDGRIDLAMSSDAVSSVAMFLGQQSGTLQPAAPVPFLTRPFAMALGDVNGDGKTDIAISKSAAQPSIEFALGKGDATFTLGSPLPAPTTVGALALLDANGDNKVDLVMGSGKEVSVYPGLGDGSFGPAKSTPHELQLLDVSSEFAVGDMNGDGLSDIVLSSGKDSRLTVFLNQGNGVLASPMYGISVKSVYSPLVADLNQDGKLDAIASVVNTQELQLFWGEGNGSLRAGARIPSFSGRETVTTADINGDGTIDIISVDSVNEAERFEVHAGDGGEVFVRSDSYPIEPLALARTVYVGDFNSDGKPDVVIAQRTGKLSLFQNVTP